MKIRTRLLIAFVIMTFFPIAAGILCFRNIIKTQNDALKKYYSVEDKGYETYEFLLNPVDFLHSITEADYMKLVSEADDTPEKFDDIDYIKSINASLKKKDTFLVIIKGGEEYFIGDESCYRKLPPLSGFISYYEGAGSSISINRKNSIMVRQKDFYFSDGTQGQFIFINDLSKIMPRWKKSVRDMGAALIIILVMTSLLLVFWIYHSIVKPLNILRVATMQFGTGDLSQPVHITSSDEIGELCRDFEEMRIRLKSILEERIQYENDIREMMSNISHDLKTPLTAIKGYTEGLMDGVAGTKEKQDKYLKTIYNKAADMSYLVDELSLFSKIEQDMVPYHFVPLRLADYFNDCIESMHFELESKNIKLYFENHTPDDTFIFADAEHLKRVMQNIIGNAEKYMDKQCGEIRVVLKERHHAEKKPLYRQVNKDGTDVQPPKKLDEFITVEISDNGPGIEKNELPFIFERFYRADMSRNSTKTGSGLGLSIARKIINDHGGRIYAASTPGSGTSIYFTLKKYL